MAGASTEPSMEDILSSIKRIIAEDSEAALSSPRVKRSVGLTPMSPAEPPQDEDEPDVLELTDAVEEAPEPEPEAAAAAFKPLPLVKPEGDPVATANPAQAEPPKKPVLASSQTVQSSKASLAALSALVIKPEITGTDTLEGMVREMIRPMLAEWINERLPDIVDRMVAEEIARITARG